MSILSPAQIAQYAANAGFTGTGLAKITAIAQAESGGNPFSFNGNDPAGGSFGLTQINGVHPGASSAYGDPQAAMDLAFKVSNGGTNFNPWSTYTNGSYRNFMGAGNGVNTGAGAQIGGTGGYSPGGYTQAPPGLSFGGSSTGGTNPIYPNGVTVGSGAAGGGNASGVPGMSIYNPTGGYFGYGGTNINGGASGGVPGLTTTDPGSSAVNAATMGPFAGQDALGNQTTSQSALSAIFAAIVNVFERGGIILLGLVIIAISAYFLASPDTRRRAATAVAAVAK